MRVGLFLRRLAASAAVACAMSTVIAGISLVISPLPFRLGEVAVMAAFLTAVFFAGCYVVENSRNDH